MSVAYAVCVEEGQLKAVAGDDAAETAWLDLMTIDGAAAPKLPEGERLAFDHAQIISDAAAALNLL